MNNERTSAFGRKNTYRVPITGKSTGTFLQVNELLANYRDED